MEEKVNEDFANAQQITEDEQIYSFAEALATVIDERTPYNGDHTRRVAEYVREFIDYLNLEYKAGRYDTYFDNDIREPLILAAFLHDIGKTVTPLSVMNKPTRLFGRLEKIRERFRFIKARLEIDMLKGDITEAEFSQKNHEIDTLYNKVKNMNSAGKLRDEDMDYVNHAGEEVYVIPGGKIVHYLTKYEIECLNIRQGTLTSTERRLMEEHVIFTRKILSKVRFTPKYKMVPLWAGNHHEYLDGTGYPNHLKAEHLDIPTRILTIVDVYDALTSRDRPYKRGWTMEDALDVLNEMASSGKLDKELVKKFGEFARA